ncbi:Mitochondrial acidic protein mam33 [Oleoguttula sp. CCFEE 5521]
MQSLRAIARAAPRATSRITSSSIRTSIRPSWTSFSTPLRTQTPRLAAAFSTSRRTFDASSTELAAKLQSELQLESENSETTVGSNGNVEAFFNDTDWKLHETDGETVVKLSRNYEGELIEVRFSIAEFNTPYEDPESSDEALMDEEDELAEGQSGGANSKGAINQGKTSGGNFKVAPEDDIAPADRDELRSAEDEQSLLPANVNVLISHPSSPNKGALRINLMADSGEFRVENVTHFPSANLPEAQVASQPLDTETAYAGPPFMQLDEDLQALFEAYLNERGIDTALAIFIPEYIDVKEQQEYVKWLGKVKEFVE